MVWSGRRGDGGFVVGGSEGARGKLLSLLGWAVLLGVRMSSCDCWDSGFVGSEFWSEDILLIRG